MGGDSKYLASGGFSRKEYYTSRWLANIKVVKHNELSNAGLPRYSNTPNTVYLHEDVSGNINEIRIYKGRKAKYDIDWGHGHGDVPNGEPHLHRWVYRKDGTFERQGGRKLKKSEKKLLEKILAKIKKENKDA